MPSKTKENTSEANLPDQALKGKSKGKPATGAALTVGEQTKKPATKGAKRGKSKKDEREESEAKSTEVNQPKEDSEKPKEAEVETVVNPVLEEEDKSVDEPQVEVSVKKDAVAEKPAETGKVETKNQGSKPPLKTVASPSDLAKRAPRRKEEPGTKKEGVNEKPKKSPKKKARLSKKGSTDEKDDEDEDEGNENEAEDEDEDQEEEEDEDDDDMLVDEAVDPEEEDVKGKGYGHVLMFTSVSADQRNKLVSSVKEVPDGHLTRQINLATHVVCDMPMRTIKLMSAILRGVWVVGSKWITDSLEAKKWLPEEPYEVKQYPGTKLSREFHAKAAASAERVPGLLAGMSFVIGHTDHTNPTKTEMKELVLAGDGQVMLTKEIDKAPFFLSCPVRPVPTNLQPTAHVITQSDFFDAIANFAKPASKPASDFASAKPSSPPATADTAATTEDTAPSPK